MLGIPDRSELLRGYCDRNTAITLDEAVEWNGFYLAFLFFKKLCDCSRRCTTIEGGHSKFQHCPSCCGASSYDSQNDTRYFARIPTASLKELPLGTSVPHARIDNQF